MEEHRTLNTEQRTSKLGRDGRAGAVGQAYDLEERLLNYAAAIIKFTEKLPSSRAGNHVAGQLLRSGTSPLSNHGEAEAAESHEDFVHKLKVCLKELRESLRWIRLVRKSQLLPEPQILPLEKESDELIRIFVASIRTSKQRALDRNRRVAPPG
jgi:four helix bundle protein